MEGWKEGRLALLPNWKTEVVVTKQIQRGAEAERERAT